MTEFIRGNAMSPQQWRAVLTVNEFRSCNLVSGGTKGRVGTAGLGRGLWTTASFRKDGPKGGRKLRGSGFRHQTCGRFNVRPTNRRILGRAFLRKDLFRSVCGGWHFGGICDEKLYLPAEKIFLGKNVFFPPMVRRRKINPWKA